MSEWSSGVGFSVNYQLYRFGYRCRLLHIFLLKWSKYWLKSIIYVPLHKREWASNSLWCLQVEKGRNKKYPTLYTFYIIMSACLLIRNIIKEYTLWYSLRQTFIREGAKILGRGAQNFRRCVKWSLRRCEHPPRVCCECQVNYQALNKV